MKKILWLLGICLFLWVASYAQIPVGNRLPLVKATHIYSTLAKWDTVYAVIFDSSGVIVTTRPLYSGGTGIWVGFYQTSVIGSFVAQYRAVYSGDTIAEESYFTVNDTLEQKISHSIGSPTGSANMATGLFEGQQYIADNMSGGAGAFACTISVKDISTAAGIYRTTVLVKNSDESATTIPGYTNANGKIMFALDSLGTGESYKLWLQNLDYTFTFPETMDVRGSATFTYYGTKFDPGSPPTSSKIAVYDQVFNIELDSIANVLITAEVRVPPDSILRYQGRIISPFKVDTTTTITGRWRFNLISNDSLQPPNTWYLFTFRYKVASGGYIVKEDSVYVPADTNYVQYKDLKGW